MATFTYPNSSFPDGTVASGTQVMANFDAVKNVVNGGISADNLAAGAVTNPKIASSAVDTGQLAAGAVTEAKMDYTSAGSGVKVAQVGPDYGGASGIRLARAILTCTIAGATTTLQSFELEWATDCLDGDPAFTSVPVILGWALVDPGTHGTPTVITSASRMGQMFFTEVSTTGAWFNIMFDVTATAGDLELHVGLLGNIG